MKNEKLIQCIGLIDDDLIMEAEMMPKQNNQPKNHQYFFRRFSVIAASIVLILAIIPLAFMLTPNNENQITEQTQKIAYASVNETTLTGSQQKSFGYNTESTSGLFEQTDMLDIYSKGFYYGIIVEAKVVEVLPNLYCKYSYQNNLDLKINYNVAKLKIIDNIRADNLPEEIYYCYPYYDETLFDGYDSFIFSLSQTGIEDYLLLNSDSKSYESFPNMFVSVLVDDPGYGSVIALNDGKIDKSFFSKANYFKNYGYNLLNYSRYVANENSTTTEIKANILNKINTAYSYENYSYNYVASEDVFISNEAKIIQNHINTCGGIFIQNLLTTDGIPLVKYTRIINGFTTNEVIFVGFDDANTNFANYSNLLSDAMLEKIPDIGQAIDNLDLAKIEPPELPVTVNSFIGCNAFGWYKNVSYKVYGIVRVLWTYQIDEGINYNVSTYYVYDENCELTIMNSNELFELIGNDVNNISNGYANTSI